MLLNHLLNTYVYSQKLPLFSALQRSFSLQWSTGNAETHYRSKCWDYVTVKLKPKLDIYMKPPIHTYIPMALGTLRKRDQKECKRWRMRSAVKCCLQDMVTPLINTHSCGPLHKTCRRSSRQDQLASQRATLTRLCWLHRNKQERTWRWE